MTQQRQATKNMLDNEDDIEQRIRKLSENAMEQFRLTQRKANYDDRYMIEETLGEGAFGSVHLARRLLDNKQVALKVLPIMNITSWSKDNSDILPTEVSIHQSLRHKNIIQLLEVFKADNSYVLVLETDRLFKLLFDFVKEKQRIKERDAKLIFHQVVDAVRYCIDSSIWHRDIKAENILVHACSLTPKLIDFGCACRTDLRDFKRQWPGTMEYCAPEYFRNGKCDAESSSLWSLGILLHFMINGRLPFYTTEDILTKGITRNPRISKDLYGLMVDLLQKEPKERIHMKDLLAHSWIQVTTELIPS